MSAAVEDEQKIADDIKAMTAEIKRLRELADNAPNSKVWAEAVRTLYAAYEELWKLPGWRESQGSPTGRQVIEW